VEPRRPEGDRSCPRASPRSKAPVSRFANETEVAPGGRQIQIEDPEGNPIELFEPASRS
jgi:hypothetical protein